MMANQATHVDMPAFNERDPRTYFDFITVLPLNDNTKFLKAYAHLPNAAIHKARHLLTSDDTDANKLQSLRDIVTTLYTKTPGQRFALLHNTKSMGDMTATQLLAFIRSCLQTEDQNGDMVKYYFLERLPESVTKMLNILNPEGNLDSMAESVERAMTRFDGTPATSALNLCAIERDTPTRPTTQANTEQFLQLELKMEQRLIDQRVFLDQKLEALQNQFAQFQNQFLSVQHQTHNSNNTTYQNPSQAAIQLPALNHPPPLMRSNVTHHNASQQGRSNPQRNNPASNPSPQNQDSRQRHANPLCYYHRLYKERARKCIPPCSYNRGN